MVIGTLAFNLMEKPILEGGKELREYLRESVPGRGNG